MIEGVPEAKALPALGTVLGSMGVGFGLHYLGGEEGRSWAVPAASFVLFLGVDRFYDVPTWAVVAGFVVTTSLFSAILRSRQREAAHKATKVDAGPEGLKLRRVPDYSGKFVGVWTTVPEGPAPVPAKEGESRFTLYLSFEGVGQDEYRVLLRGVSPRAKAGALTAWSAESGQGPEPNEQEVTGLPSQPFDLRLSAKPLDFAFQLADIAFLAGLQEVLSLRRPARALRIHVQGAELAIASSAVFSEQEIPSLLRAALGLLRRIDALGGVPQE